MPLNRLNRSYIDALILTALLVPALPSPAAGAGAADFGLYGQMPLEPSTVMEHINTKGAAAVASEIFRKEEVADEVMLSKRENGDGSI